MSKLTPTNEESLISYLQSCPKGCHIRLCPSPDNSTLSLLEVYEIPNSIVFEYLDEKERRKYRRGAFMAVALHPEVWETVHLPARYSIAAGYR